ncbi:MAG: hypothetical protein DI616_03205 [Paracoccus denitrificans]|uniref:VCBS repeat-containing protein n=1 Tax=Paracoccus denitrificans TaxID=266 RepID=A0A533I9J9_PARDE|nr:MAG: hypothetical protein DI616_03205 [Paracoccus denitrificans]
MRLLAVVAITLLPQTALSAEDASGLQVDAAYKSPVESNPLDRPAWRNVEFWLKREKRSDGIVSRLSTSRRWDLTSDEGGFYYGDRPELADVNRDGETDVVAIQYVPEDGWRMVVFSVSMGEIGVLSSAEYDPAVNEAILLGVADLAANGDQYIAVIKRQEGVSGLSLYSFDGDAPVMFGPFAGYDAGPQGALPYIRRCGDQSVFLVERSADHTVAAVGKRAGDTELQVWNSDIPATQAGFAKAAACG